MLRYLRYRSTEQCFYVVPVNQSLLDDNFFSILFLCRLQYILGPLTHLMEDYVVRILDSAGKDLILLNNRDLKSYGRLSCHLKGVFSLIYYANYGKP